MALLHVGSTQDKETVEAIATALIRIVQASGDQKSIRKALEVFGSTAHVKNVNVNHCSFISNPPTEKDVPKPADPYYTGEDYDENGDEVL